MKIEVILCFVVGLVVMIFNRQFAHAQRDWQRKIGFKPPSYNINRITIVFVGICFWIIAALLYAGILHT